MVNYYIDHYRRELDSNIGVWTGMMKILVRFGIQLGKGSREEFGRNL